MAHSDIAEYGNNCPPLVKSCQVFFLNLFHILYVIQLKGGVCCGCDCVEKLMRIREAKIPLAEKEGNLAVGSFLIFPAVWDGRAGEGWLLECCGWSQ